MRHYSMIFYTSTGGRRSIRINNPDPDLPVSEISDAVDQLLANDVFDPESGSLASLGRMELTTIERTAIL